MVTFRIDAPHKTGAPGGVLIEFNYDPERGGGVATDSAGAVRELVPPYTPGRAIQNALLLAGAHPQPPLGVAIVCGTVRMHVAPDGGGGYHVPYFTGKPVLIPQGGSSLADALDHAVVMLEEHLLLDRLVRREYTRLVEVLGLTPLDLDIYRINPSRADKTIMGTPIHNLDAGYTHSHLVLPQDPANISTALIAPAFPPAVWSRVSPDWPLWRCEVWHEVVHQFQDERLNMLNRQVGHDHGAGWLQAITDVAGAFQITGKQLSGVL